MLCWYERVRTEDLLAGLRSACLALPEATERLSHGAPAWFVRGKRTFVMFADCHHGSEHVAFWAAAPPGVAGELAAAEPARFFVPPYVGHRGWLGMRLDLAGDDAVDWAEVAAVVADAYRQVAPKALVAVLDA